MVLANANSHANNLNTANRAYNNDNLKGTRGSVLGLHNEKLNNI